MIQVTIDDKAAEVSSDQVQALVPFGDYTKIIFINEEFILVDQPVEEVSRLVQMDLAQKIHEDLERTLGFIETIKTKVDRQTRRIKNKCYL